MSVSPRLDARADARSPLPPPYAQRARGPHAHGASQAGPAEGGVRRTLSIPKDFPRLLELDSASLAELLLDKETFARFLHGTEGASEARAFTRDLRLEIESMARANIALAEEAADLRSQISVIRAVDMKPVAEAYAEAKAKTDALVGEHDVGRALRSLQERARASDAKSEEVNEKWLDGEIKDVDAFVDAFRRLREKHHEDAIKASIVEPALASAGGGARGAPPPPPPARGYPGRPRYG